MEDLNDLYYFVQVVDHGGFAPAGRAIGAPKSKLSRRVAALEERLGVQLLRRSTRRFSVTEIGEIYYAHCKAMLVEAEAAEEAIARTRSEPCGTVRVTCPVTLLDVQVGAMIADFMVDNPRVEVHLEATNRRVDVIGEGLDVAIRVRPPPLSDTGLVMRVLGERRQCLVACPRLVEDAGVPRVPGDLVGLPSMDLGSPRDDHAWHLEGPDGTRATIAHRPRLVTRGMLTLRDAALAGVGVVQLPWVLVAEHLAAGDLVRVVPTWEPRVEVVHAVFASRRGLLPAVRALIDSLAERFAALALQERLEAR